MLLVLHVVIALTSIVWTGLAYFAPSTKKLNITYALIAATLASGTYLAITMHSPLLKSCMTGLVYLAVVLFETFAVRSRLAQATNR